MCGPSHGQQVRSALLETKSVKGKLTSHDCGEFIWECPNCGNENTNLANRNDSSQSCVCPKCKKTVQVRDIFLA